MFNNSLTNYTLMSYKSYEQDSEKKYISSIINSIVNASEDTMVITDNKFRVIISNNNNIKKGENIFNRLKLKKQHINKDSKNIKRSLIIDKTIYLYEIDIIQINSYENSNDGYIIIMRNLSKKMKFKKNYLNLINFIRHNLTIPILSQITALKLVLKSKDNNYLLPEILNSEEYAYRILKNYLEESDYDSENIKIRRKETGIKNFIESVEKECKNFISLKKNKLKIDISRNSRVYIDSKLLRNSLVNILYELNELCKENNLIEIKTDICHRVLRITIKFSYGKLSKEIFSKQKCENNLYTKLGKNSGLYLAEQIIIAHSGNIKIKNENEQTYLKISLPK